MTVIVSICTTAVTVGTITATSVWYVRSGYIEQLNDRLSVYEKSSSWKLPDTLERLNKASKKLELTLDERASLQNKEREVIELNSKNADLIKELNEKSDKLAESNKMLATLTSEEDTFTLSVGESHPLIKNEIVIALKSVLPSKGYFSFMNYDVDLDVGNYKEYGFGNNKCKVFLSKVNYKAGTVVLTSSCSQLK